MVSQPSSQRTSILVLARFMMLGLTVHGTLRKPSPTVNPACQPSVINPAP